MPTNKPYYDSRGAAKEVREGLYKRKELQERIKRIQHDLRSATGRDKVELQDDLDRAYNELATKYHGITEKLTKNRRSK